MTFSVEPSAVESYGAQVDRAGDDAGLIKGYLEKYQVDSGWDGILIEAVGRSHIESMDTARSVSGKIAAVLHESHTGLVATANYYRLTDLANAASFDATVVGRCAFMPSVLVQQWSENPCAPWFLDSREPAGRLVPVAEVEYTHPLAVLDNISVSNWMLKGFDFVFGFNPLEKVSEFFIGDWQAVARGGRALGNAGTAFDDLAYNVQGGAIAVKTVWHGNAADAAYAHFTDLSTQVEGLVSPLGQIAKQFEMIAHGVWSAAEAVTGWVKGIADAAIIAGIAVAAGTVTAETGIGVVVGYGVATLQVAEMLTMWAQATAAMTNLYSMVQTALGVIESQLAFLREADLPQMAGLNAYPFAGSGPLTRGASVMHDSVYEIAGGDPRKARLLRESLEKLAAGPDERLKEMARSVLNGETDLRQEAASDAYGDARDVDHCRDSAGRLGAETGRSKAWRSHSCDQGG